MGAKFLPSHCGNMSAVLTNEFQVNSYLLSLANQILTSLKSLHLIFIHLKNKHLFLNTGAYYVS